jgi:hypothetical protein
MYNIISFKPQNTIIELTVINSTHKKHYIGVLLSKLHHPAVFKKLAIQLPP